MDESVSIVGFRQVDFTDEKGHKISGYTLYYNQDPDDDKVTGCIAGKQFISSTRCDYIPSLGDTVVFRYNKYGKICAVEVI